MRPFYIHRTKFRAALMLFFALLWHNNFVVCAVSAIDSKQGTQQNGKAIITALLDSCESLNSAKDYAGLNIYADSLISMIKGDQFRHEQLEAYYYLTRSKYFLREYEDCIDAASRAIEQAIALDSMERLSYLYNVMGIAYRRMDDCNEAIDYYLKAVEVNQSLADSVKVSRNYNNLAICYQEVGDYHNSFVILNKAMNIRAELKDTVGMANVLLNIGNGYFEISDYQAAYENYMKASELYEAIGDEEMVISSLFNVGLVFQELNDYDKALESYDHAVEHAVASGDDEFLGLIYQNVGNLYSNRNEFKKSLEYHRKAEVIFDTLQSMDQLSEIWLNMGLEFMHESKMDSAEVYLYKAYEHVKDHASISDYINLIIEMGHFHTLNEEYDKAEEFLVKAVALAEATEYLKLSRYANKYLFELYKKTNRLELAIDHLLKYQMFKDSIDRSEQERNIENYKLRSDLNAQEDQIKLLNKENELEVAKAANQQRWFLGLMAFMVIIIGGVSYQFNFARKKNRIISKEKERSDELLLNILPDETAEELKNFGKVKAKEYEMATVMFTDFVDFTKYSEKMRSEDIVRSVDYYFSAFDEIMERNDVEKIKTIGDAYMCVGGIPNPDKDNARKVIKAAQEILAFVEQTNEDPEGGIIPFKIRIGINSGPVVAGVVGLHKFQYDIWGDTVNIASRMESACEPGRINISETTYDLINKDYPCSYRGEKDLKNKGMMKMYYLD